MPTLERTRQHFLGNLQWLTGRKLRIARHFWWQAGQDVVHCQHAARSARRGKGAEGRSNGLASRLRDTRSGLEKTPTSKGIGLWLERV